MEPIIFSRFITLWMVSISVGLYYILSSDHNSEDLMYRFGPHEDLIILGMRIDTNEKYVILVLYTILNTIVRNVNHNVIGPWIILNIQDDTNTGTIKKDGAISECEQRVDYAVTKPLNQTPSTIAPLSRNFILTSYEISTCSTVYNWFDWFIYIHLLLSQIDIVIIEMGVDVLTNTILVSWYLKKKTQVPLTATVDPEWGRRRPTELRRHAQHVEGGLTPTTESSKSILKYEAISGASRNCGTSSGGERLEHGCERSEQKCSEGICRYGH